MRRLTVSLLLALGLANGAALAQSYSTVEERMSGAEFKAAGLEKLSPAELAALNAWLQKQQDRVLATESFGPGMRPVQDRNGFDDAASRREIRSRLVGEFKGWTGNARFVLENGQEWQQTDGEVLAGIKAMSNPAVTIKPGLISGWKLQVEGYNSTVKVKRVK